MAKARRNNGMTALALFGVAAGMIGLAYASVPLYELFCKVTGYGGTPNTAAAAPAAVSDRSITVRFDANTNRALPWRFKPVAKQVTVRLGERKLAFYNATNLGSETVTGTATFNVTPFKVAQYFSKIDCFCFTEQTLKPGQQVPMPVEFFVDPEIYEDPNTKEVRTITLSYTFYRMDGDDNQAAQMGERPTTTAPAADAMAENPLEKT